ncbi:hypothetical protein [Phycicoccus sonneratiae]|uniref:WXG100 family type VII secretion target n=1 Tax=Phycicoccus sonneratiae TaxID=2807628 RepID=A0ABS2CJ51_9MICO|nr:hypothetical protein [Phycicoccus sonneraticus]MBM6399904.1 hypothetical protein [Phycicoccus sonneraticus]
MAEVDDLERLAARVRAGAELVGVRRAGLLGTVVPGWVGGAAEGFQEAVAHRVASLAALEDELGWLAEAVDGLAAAVRSEAADGGLGRAS